MINILIYVELTVNVFLVASILLDEKTPTAETFSPLKEDPESVKLKTVPPPKQSDFASPENDLYSERCTELLDNLESVTEETENDFKLESQSVNSMPKINNGNNVTSKSSLNIKNNNLKLTPLDLKEDNIELPKNQQKLTTPGNRR